MISRFSVTGFPLSYVITGILYGEDSDLSTWVTWFSKLSEFLKNPQKMMALIWLGSGFCLVAPDTWLQVTGLFNFVAQYRDPFIGLAFGVTSLWFLYDIVARIYARIVHTITMYRKKKDDEKTQKKLIEYLDRLTKREGNIIKRFSRDGRNIVGLRLEGEDVFDLIEKGIICQLDGMEEQTPLGMYHYFKLNDLIKPYVFSKFPKGEENEIDV